MQSFVIPLRFERRTHSLEGCCSIQLSYGTILILHCKSTAFFDIYKHLVEKTANIATNGFS